MLLFVNHSCRTGHPFKATNGLVERLLQKNLVCNFAGEYRSESFKLYAGSHTLQVADENLGWLLSLCNSLIHDFKTSRKYQRSSSFLSNSTTKGHYSRDLKLVMTGDFLLMKTYFQNWGIYRHGFCTTDILNTRFEIHIIIIKFVICIVLIFSHYLYRTPARSQNKKHITSHPKSSDPSY